MNKQKLFFALTAEHSVTTHVSLGVDRWRTDQRLAGFLHVPDNSRLGTESRVVGDHQMAGYSDLPGDDAVLPDLGRSGDSTLSRHYRVVSYLDIMGDLAKVVDLHAISNDG